MAKEHCCTKSYVADCEDCGAVSPFIRRHRRASGIFAWYQKCPWSSGQVLLAGVLENTKEPKLSQLRVAALDAVQTFLTSSQVQIAAMG